jgi:hypothetical protein
MPTRILAIALFMDIALFCGCCHKNQKVMLPSVFRDNVYSKASFDNDYKQYKAARDGSKESEARMYRNIMIYQIEADIELIYRQFEQKFSSSRDKFQTGSDVVELGVTAAIGVVEGSAVKELLAASLTGFKGTRLSIDKNYYREKTTEIIITQMQAYRESVRNRITEKTVKLSVSDYPFEEAKRDLIEYYYAGTVHSAFQQLAIASGQAASTQIAEAKAIDKGRANTEDEAKAAIRIRDNFYKLSTKIKDSGTHDSALKEIKSILAILAVSTDGKTDADLIDLLKQSIKNALNNPSQILQLDKILPAN